jgi:hypothetical protein
VSAREDLLSVTRKVLWKAWALSSDEIGSVAAEALLSLGMLVEPGGAGELERLRVRVTELEQREAVVAEFVASRAEYITALRNCHPDNGHDYDRWQGHAAARRQLAESLGLPVAWPPEDAASVARSRDGEFHEALHHDYRVPHDLPEQAEVFVPRTERERWVDIANALNAAHAAGMPVGIDLDGTLTDHRHWSVVWDRDAERWTVAGYDDGEPHDLTEPGGVS